MPSKNRKGAYLRSKKGASGGIEAAGTLSARLISGHFFSFLATPPATSTSNLHIFAGNSLVQSDSLPPLGGVIGGGKAQFTHGGKKISANLFFLTYLYILGYEKSIKLKICNKKKRGEKGG
jgi:hypothetical protein